MKLLILLFAIVFLSSCEGTVSMKQMKPSNPTSSTNHLTIEKIEGHEYAVYFSYGVGVAMVHHAGCKGSHF